MIKRETYVVVYAILFFIVLTQRGEVNKIISYNTSGVSSLRSTHLETKYLPPKEEEHILKQEDYLYRLTSYYPYDECNSGTCTGSGLCIENFQTNEKGWYTYKGKLVLAAATTYLQNKFGTKENKLYFKYYDEVTLTVDGKKYEGIILDTCGACYKSEKIDLFVSNEKSVIDRGYKGKNMISLEVAKKS